LQCNQKSIARDGWSRAAFNDLKVQFTD
jgi:hypothetical protein